MSAVRFICGNALTELRRSCSDIHAKLADFPVSAFGKKRSDDLDATGNVALNLLAAESYDGPPRISRCSIKQSVVGGSSWEAMPVLPVSLNYESGLVKNKVRLPASKHRPVHLEREASNSKGFIKSALDFCHLGGETLAHSCCPYEGASFVAHGRSKCPERFHLLHFGSRATVWGCLKTCYDTLSAFRISPYSDGTTSATAINVRSFYAARGFADGLSAGRADVGCSYPSKAQFRATCHRTTARLWSERIVVGELYAAVTTIPHPAFIAIQGLAVNWLEHAGAYYARLWPKIARFHIGYYTNFLKESYIRMAFELSADYIALAEARLRSDAGMFADIDGGCCADAPGAADNAPGQAMPDLFSTAAD